MWVMSKSKPWALGLLLSRAFFWGPLATDPQVTSPEGPSSPGDPTVHTSSNQFSCFSCFSVTHSLGELTQCSHALCEHWWVSFPHELIQHSGDKSGRQLCSSLGRRCWVAVRTSITSLFSLLCVLHTAGHRKSGEPDDD